jgi:hypothetical protein
VALVNPFYTLSNEVENVDILKKDKFRNPEAFEDIKVLLD